MSSELTAGRLRYLLDYDPETGLFAWRELGRGRRVGWFEGCDNGDGHRQISVDGKAYLAHRLAWLHVYGEWPVGRLDHRDYQPANNRILNLRPATHSQNKANCPRYKNNSTGFKGVYRVTGYDRWKAKIRKDGHLHHLGCFGSPEEAHEAYHKAAERFHGEFARAA